MHVVCSISDSAANLPFYSRRASSYAGIWCRYSDRTIRSSASGAFWLVLAPWAPICLPLPSVGTTHSTLCTTKTSCKLVDWTKGHAVMSSASTGVGLLWLITGILPMYLDTIVQNNAKQLTKHTVRWEVELTKEKNNISSGIRAPRKSKLDLIVIQSL